jgi:hypothetical protein
MDRYLQRERERERERGPGVPLVTTQEASEVPSCCYIYLALISAYQVGHIKATNIIPQKKKNGDKSQFKYNIYAPILFLS